MTALALTTSGCVFRPAGEATNCGRSPVNGTHYCFDHIDLCCEQCGRPAVRECGAEVDRVDGPHGVCCAALCEECNCGHS